MNPTANPAKNPAANPAAIILAAGFSRRLGRPKQTLILNGSTLLERAIISAQQASLAPIIVVIHDPSVITIPPSPTFIVLTNLHADRGMSTSVHTGVHWLQEHPVTGAVLMTCDQPVLRPQHLRDLCADPHRITGSAYAGRIGVPAYFPAKAFPSLLHLSGDTGARGLLANAAFITDESLALDIDTEEDLVRAREALLPRRQ